MERRRAGIIIGLYQRRIWSRPPGAEPLETRRQKRTASITVPSVASGVFAVCFTDAIRAVAATMPASVAAPDDLGLRVTEAMQVALTYCSGWVLAFVGIYAWALANGALTVAVWRLFALVSPAGAVPQWRWFVRQASSACAYVALLVFATGLVFPYFRRGADTAALAALIRDHAATAVMVTVLLMVLQRLRDRSNAIVGRDIWGSAMRAKLATLIKIASTWTALALMNELILRWR